MNLNLKYPKNETQLKNEANPITTLNLIEYFINKKHPEIKGQMRRTLGRLQDKLNKARDKELKAIDLAPDERDFLVDLNITELGSPVQWSMFVGVLEEEMRRLSDQDILDVMDDKKPKKGKSADAP